jgi:hypothetical protein
VATGGDQLGDEERVARREAVEFVDVDVGPLREPRHRLPGQGREPHPRHGRRRREVAQDGPQWVSGTDLVAAVRRDHQRARAADPAAEEAQEVERGVVGPMDVLEHGHGGQLPEGVDQEIEHAPTAADAVEQLRERRTETRRHVDERPQRPRRLDGVATPQEHASYATGLRTEALHERRLADAGLTADEHHGAPARCGCAKARLQGLQLLMAFEELRGHVDEH